MLEAEKKHVKAQQRELEVRMGILEFGRSQAPRGFRCGGWESD